MTFPCSSCGACCRKVGAIPEALREGKIEPDEFGVCKNLSPDNRCNLYDTRPRVCRVSESTPPGLSRHEWYNANLRACDALHLSVYGSPRIPLEVL